MSIKNLILSDVVERTKWPRHSKVALLPNIDDLRYRLTKLLLDRLYQGKVTSVNEEEYRTLMVDYRDGVNPSNATSMLHIYAGTNIVRGGYNLDRSTASSEMRAVLKTLSEMTGNTFKSIDDLIDLDDDGSDWMGDRYGDEEDELDEEDEEENDSEDDEEQDDEDDDF